MLWTKVRGSSSLPLGTSSQFFMPRAKLPFKKFDWNSELAYAIGLIVTDGNLSKDGRHIIMRSSDKSQLETFRICLGANNKISKTYDNGPTKRPCYRIQLGNVQFYHWLMSIGIEPAKTHTIGKIKIPNKYFRDFLRGHLDGDGTIITYLDRYNTYKGRTYANHRLFVKFISASKKHLAWLHKKIKAIAKVNGALICNMPRRENRVPMYEIKFAKKESLKLLQWLYYQPNLPCLKRKRQLAEKLIKIMPNEKRRKYVFIHVATDE